MRLRRDLVLKNAGLLGSSRLLGPCRSLFRLLARLSGPGNARPIEILFRQTFNRTVNPREIADICSTYVAYSPPT